MNHQNRRYRAAQVMLANWPQDGMRVVREALKKWPLGGLVFHSHDIPSPEWLRETTRELWSLYERNGWSPPWFAVTEEGGTVQRFRQWFDIPSAMSLGQLTVPDTSYETGSLVGQFLLAHGINWNFAPVVDVLTEKHSPIVGTRSFGADPAIVSAHAVAWLLGQQSAGVVSTAKHFPGHGMTARDSHLERPVVSIDMDQLAAHLEPFRKTVEAGVQAVMTAHIVYPMFDELPATLSPFWLQEILRHELGFAGLVVTDALSMKGIAHHVDPVMAATQAIIAGVDVIDCGGTFEQALRMCDVLYHEMDTSLVAQRMSDIEKRLELFKQNLRTPSQWPPSPEEKRLLSIYHKIETAIQRRGSGTTSKLTPPFVEVWVSGSPPTEVQEDAPELMSGVFWVDTENAEAWKEKLTEINEKAAVKPIILYTENLWKHPNFAEQIQTFIGDKIQVVVVIQDPVDEELFDGVTTCIKVYGNRQMARRIFSQWL